jgi:uncharacterized damage-inducible protein DinB
MSLAHSLLAEFEEQAPITRRFLERLPEDRLTWKPHNKSMTAGQLALHLAQVPGGVVRLAQLNPAQAPGFQAPQPRTQKEILDAFEESIGFVRGILPKFDEAGMQESWSVVMDGRELFAMPRWRFIRDIMLNHWYQHRGQFGVYLRLLDIAVPSSWGPSADEAPNFLQRA